jgi:ABC-2 type transport system permease protein
MNKIILDTWLLFMRNLKKNLRAPMWLFLGLMQPVLYLLLYMPLLKNLGGTASLPLGQIAQIFVPGMLVIMGISNLFAGFGFIPEIREGYVTRLLVTPISRLSILVGLIMNQIFTLLLQAILLLIIASFLGLQTSILSVILVLVLIVLIGTTMASLSYIISIITKSEDALAPLVNTLFLPIMLLSGIMLPISLAPDWLKTAAHFNPFYYAVEASRSLFLGNFTDSIVPIGFLVMGLAAALTVYFAVRSLQKMS